MVLSKMMNDKQFDYEKLPTFKKYQLNMNILFFSNAHLKIVIHFYKYQFQFL